MSVAQKLSWEIVALNDRGDSSYNERLAVEIAYGVSLAQGDSGSFMSTMTSIAEQVTDPQLKRLLMIYAKRGIAK